MSNFCCSPRKQTPYLISLFLVSAVRTVHGKLIHIKNNVGTLSSRRFFSREINEMYLFSLRSDLNLGLRLCRYEELIVCVKVMANLSASNISNIFNQLKNATPEGNTGIAPLELSDIITIIINCVACPFTVLLNVLVIIAVKRRPSLQTYTNILLACLAVTDALTGVTAQPSYVLWRTSQLLGIKNSDLMRVFHSSSLRALSLCSALHLALVTFERLIAIKFTMRYPYIITNQKIKVAVMAFWVYIFSCEILRRATAALFFNLLASLVLISCILFVAASYIILYRESIRQRQMIKVQQITQQDEEIFTKERKALKTTVFVVGSMVLCFSPVGVAVF